MTRTTVVLAPNPGIYTGPGTNSYLVGEGDELICIDPGPDERAHLAALLSAATRRGGRITRILLTHSHPDHRPLARALAEATVATVHCFDPALGDERGQALGDGDSVTAGGVSLRAVHTPGHARDHLCYLDAEADELYTGDHILGGTTTVVAPPDGDMTDYLKSLSRVRELRPRVIHPGHGPRLDDGVAVIDQYIAHRLEREAQVETGLGNAGDAVAPIDLVPEIYASYPRELWPAAAKTIEAHLDRLVREDRAQLVISDGERRYRTNRRTGA
ncbi:MAG: MBL fold metallo-hydrolase [Chloroflexi bacterium]|nr:MAG: MBL fold metallo-hydrolase [Chloroflexota bacterium]